MLRSLHIARTGLDVQQTQLDVISNNLANVSTTGFKKARAVFEDLLYQTIRQPGAQSSQQTQLPSGFQLGVGARTVATERIFTQGSLQQTSNALDVAISGRGFFQVQLPDGGTAYTRDGSFQVDSQGNLVTASGYAVLPNMQIPQDALVVTIAKDGIVSVTQPGTPNTVSQLGQIQLATFVNTAGLQSQGENLYIETAASGTAQVDNPGNNGLGTLNQSFIETSNVNVAEELVNMIIAQRAYEINSRAITTSDQMLQRLTQILMTGMARGKENAMRTILLVTAFLAILAGCATPPPATAIKLPLNARPEAVAAPLGNGAIFQAGNSQPRPAMALFEDRKARHVGDTLIVNLVENTEAKRKSETTDERKANASFDIPSPTVLGRNTSLLGATTWEPSANNKQEFKDNETNSNQIKGAITVTVVEVLANGHLVVAGEKQVAINNDTEYIRLAGVVNPAQITASNTVNSTQLANAQFESKNAQSLDKSLVGSMMARFFLTILPF